jgi:hypothetical protein
MPVRFVRDAVLQHGYLACQVASADELNQRDKKRNPSPREGLCLLEMPANG